MRRAVLAAAVVGASAAGAWAARAKGLRVPIGETGWSLILPPGWKASPWRAPAPTAAKGYFGGGPYGGGGEFSWVSEGRRRSEAATLERVAYVEHKVEAEVVTLAWIPGKPPDFPKELCGDGEGPRVPPLEGRLFGRLTFSFECGRTTRKRTRYGQAGATASSHFVVVLGTAAWTPYTSEWYRQSRIGIHLSYRSAWENVFGSLALASFGRAAAAFQAMRATLAPGKGDEIPPPSAAAPPSPEPSPAPEAAPPAQDGAAPPDVAVPLLR